MSDRSRGAIRSAIVCIGTYRRHHALERLLASLRHLDVPGVWMAVLVLDNEPSSAVAGIVRRHAEETGHDIRYREVLRPGIASVRNAALEAARGFDCLLFIDDDETAPPGWPAGLIDVARELDADVVAGAVEHAFEGPVVPWIVRGACLDIDRPKLPEGAELPYCATSNTLVMTRTIGRVPGGFDDRYGLTGGSDSLYFAQQRRSGAKIVWAPHAPVVEHVPVERARLGWLLRRAYRNGTVRGRMARDMRGSELRLLGRAIKGAAAFAQGILQLAGAVGRRERGTAAHGLQRVAVGLGTWAGLLGLPYVEYRRRS